MADTDLWAQAERRRLSEAARRETAQSWLSEMRVIEERIDDAGTRWAILREAMEREGR